MGSSDRPPMFAQAMKGNGVLAMGTPVAHIREKFKTFNDTLFNRACGNRTTSSSPADASASKKKLGCDLWVFEPLVF